MGERGGSVVAAGLVVAMCAGCSSAYIPHPGPRLSLTMDDGSLAYVRDGHKYEGGFFGGQIEEAVRGNPQAEAYAHAYRSGMVTGFALELISLAGIIGGATLAASESSQQPNDGSAAVPGALVLVGGLVLDLVATGVMLGAEPHLFDAVNAYNDGLTAPGPAPAPATAPASP